MASYKNIKFQKDIKTLGEGNIWVSIKYYRVFKSTTIIMHYRGYNYVEIKTTVKGSINELSCSKAVAWFRNRKSANLRWVATS